MLLIFKSLLEAIGVIQPPIRIVSVQAQWSASPMSVQATWVGGPMSLPATWNPNINLGATD